MTNLKSIAYGLLAFCFFVSIYNCEAQKESTKPMILKGHITNPQEDYVIILDGTQSDSLKLDEKGRFEFKPSNSQPRFVGMMLERNLLNIVYLQPGSDVLLEADGQSLAKRDISSIKISGPKSEESQFLIYLEKKDQDRTQQYHSSKMNVMKAEEFEMAYGKKLEALQKSYDAFLKKSPESKSFISDLKILDDIERERSFDMYPRMYKIFSKDTVPQSYAFKTYKYQIPLDKANLYNYNLTYGIYVDRHYDALIEEKYPKNMDYESQSLNVGPLLDFYQNNTMPEVGERKVVKLMGSYINFPEASRKILKERYKDFVKDSSKLARIEVIVNTTESLAKGQPAPEIAYPDKDGNMVSTKDFMGKVIYIDLWATWCAPCKEQIPYLEKLVEEFKGHDNLVFMSVAIKDNEARWRKMLEEKNMGGIQLYSGNTMNVAINRDYTVNTIPRFLIIGKDGTIVDAFATKPSDPETKALLEQLVAN